MKHDSALHSVPPTTPTTDLYFAWSMAQDIACGRVERLAPTVYRTETHLLVCRAGTVPAGAAAGRKLVYLIDDDVSAGIASNEVPWAYRLKLAVTERPQMAELVRQASLIVTSSPVLMSRLTARYPSCNIACLPPSWPMVPPRGDEVDGDGPLEVALLMGMSHRRNVQPIYADLRDLLAKADVRLTLSANLAPPFDLTRDPRVSVLPVLGWGDYLGALAGRRFDLMLYPMPGDCAFNMARSDSKLGEAAAVNAALVAQAGWATRLGLSAADRIFEIGAEGWLAGLLRIVGDRPAIASVAARNRQFLQAEDRSALQRRFWLRELGLQ